MKKAIFLDRDGTINVDHGYVYKVEDFQFLPGVIDALKKLGQMGFLLVIITNQSGIARGYYQEEDYLKLNEWMMNKLKEEGIQFAASLYCPHHPEAKVSKYRKQCQCRKPGIALFQQACRELDIDISQSYAIGDKERDLSFCKNKKTRGILLYQPQEKQFGNIRTLTNGLMEAALLIEKDMRNKDEG